MAFCSDTASVEPTDVLLFDNGLKIEIRDPIVYLGSYHITIYNEARKIEIKGTKREVDQWLESIEKVRDESPWVQNHRFGSFAPVRSNAKVKWFVDGESMILKEWAFLCVKSNCISLYRSFQCCC